MTPVRIYHQQLQQATTSCKETVEQFLQQIEQTQHLNAFTAVYSGEALKRAAELDEARKAGKPMGLLHGVVIAVKDVICQQGHKISAASKILQDFESIFTATALQRLIDAEAIIIGACNCDEFAMGSTNENSAYGPVKNGLDEARVPGGSSGGSAVAVQMNCCMLSLGSDTGGSVRQPADFCGIIGYKPGYGTISRYGLIAYASSFDQIGIFGHHVADIALALEVMNGPDPYDSTASAEKLPSLLVKNEQGNPELVKNNAAKHHRIAVFSSAINHPSLDPEIAASINHFIHKLRHSGHEVDEVPFDLMDYVVPAYYVLTTAEASTNLSRYDGVRFGHRTSNANLPLDEFYCHTRSEGFGKEVKRRIMLGSFVLSAGYYDAYFGKAQQVRRLLLNQVNRLFETYDAVLLPVSPSTAFKTGEKSNDPIEMYLADIYTVFANLVGIPGIALPLFNHSNGMPFGLQLMAARRNELHLLQIADDLMNLKTSVQATAHE